MAEEPYKIDTPSAATPFLVATFFGALAATIAYAVCDRLATPDQQAGSIQAEGAYKFAFYVTALAGGLAFSVALKVYKHLADKKYAASLGPAKATALEVKN